MHRNSNWKGWEFVKGGLKDGESSERALLREVYEETGLNRFSVKGRVSEQRKFMDPEGEEHLFDVYLVKASMNIPIQIDKKEHDTFLWATQERVIEKLTWEDEKRLFIKTVKALEKLEQKETLVTAEVPKKE